MKQLMILMLVLMLCSCKRDSPAYSFEQEQADKEGLSAEEDEFIAALPILHATSANIILDNGETMDAFRSRIGSTILTRVSSTDKIMSLPDDKVTQAEVQGPGDDKGIFIWKMLTRGLAISEDRTPYSKEDPVTQLNEVSKKTLEHLKPDQIGFSYVFNANTSLNERKQAGACPLLLYGIECSGFVTLMLNNAGVSFSQRYRAADLALEGVVNGALRASPGLKNFNYEYETQPKTFETSITSGDIVYFRDTKGVVIHIGVVYNVKNGVPVVMQSNGRRDVGKKAIGNIKEVKGCEVHDQTKGRGPHQVSLRDMTLKWGNDFKDYGFLHLVPKKKVPDDLVGKWKVSGENSSIGQGNNRVAIKSLNLENPYISFDANNSFIASSDDQSEQYYGTFTTFYHDTYIRFNGIQLYGQDPSQAQILELSSQKLRVLFTIARSGYTQYSELILEKQNETKMAGL